MVGAPLCRSIGLFTLPITMAGCQYVSGASELEVVSSKAQQPNWSCVGSPKEYEPDAEVPYSESVRNLADDSIITELTVRVCEAADPDCAKPLVVTTPANGKVEFTLKASFLGYFELSSPGMMPAIVELSRPIGQMRVLPEFRMVEASRFQQISLFVGVVPDQTLGHVQYWVYDCDGKKARGVALEVMDPPAATTQRYYALDSSRPSVSADRTDDSGGGGFVNLPTGFLTFRALRASDELLLSEYSARIRAGSITYSVIEPE